MKKIVILILAVLIFACPILATFLYINSWELIVTRLLFIILFTCSFYIIGKTIQLKNVQWLYFGIINQLIFLIFVADFYSFYLQAESFNERFFFHVRWDVILIGAKAYPIISLILFILLGINLYFSLKVKQISLNFPKYIKLIALFLLPLSLFISNPIVGLVSQINSNINSQNIDHNIIEVTDNNITAKSGKNLVLIYLESLEKNYLDQNIFPSLTPNLHQLSQESLFLDNFQQKQGSGWTIAGIYSSQCGLPLIAKETTNNHVNDGNEVLYETNNNKIICLSDILNAANYKQVFYGGADLNFAGKGYFLKQHRYDQVYGLNELKSKLPPNSKKAFMGLYDQDLFKLALDEYKILSKSTQPFNLTLLTLDTHHPHGHPDKRCPKYQEDPDNSMLNAVHCSDYLLAKFISDLKKEPQWDNTIVMVMSDHLAMRNTVVDKLEKNQRLLTGFILNSQMKNQKLTEPMYHVDIPTTLLDIMEVSHNHNFLMSHSLFKRLGNNIHPPTPFDSPQEFKKLKAQIKSMQKSFFMCKESINFQTQDNINFIEFGNDKLILNDKGHTQLNGNKIYLINTNQDGEIVSAKYINKENLSEYIYSENDGLSLFITQNSTLNNTQFQSLNNGKKNKNQWISYLGKKNTRGFFVVANKFDQLNIKKENCQDIQQLKKIERIAHAGGGVEGKTYTNSFDALDTNLQKGFKYFELDFSFTSDHNLVCIHDWENSFKRSFGFEKTKIPSLPEFEQLVITKSEFNKCTLDSLILWLKENPEAFIITDIKGNNIKGLSLIAQKYPDQINRFIPQIYQPNQFEMAKNLGYKNIIWTLYRYNGNNKSVIEFAKNNLLFAITMPIDKAKSGLSKDLSNLAIPTYVHTINKEDILEELINEYQVTNIYTDFLPLK